MYVSNVIDVYVENKIPGYAILFSESQPSGKVYPGYATFDWLTISKRSWPSFTKAPAYRWEPR
jgi:hypothetical protein